MATGLVLHTLNAAPQLPSVLSWLPYKFNEVGLLDAGSTDSTVALFNAWAAEHPGTTTHASTSPLPTLNFYELNENNAAGALDAGYLMEAEWLLRARVTATEAQIIGN